MHSELITAVTGGTRSGTSLMMQSCHLAGAPVSGNLYPLTDQGKIDQDAVTELFHRLRKENAKELNPRGFYEILGVVINGLRTIDDQVRGRVVKIVASGIWPRTLANGRELGTPPELVDKYILCLRHPRQIIRSQESFPGPVLAGKEAKEADKPVDWGFIPQPPSALAYLSRMGGLVMWLKEQAQEIIDRFLPVDFADMLSQPAETLARVFEHIDYCPSADQFNLAVGNIAADLKRSVGLKEWATEMEEEGLLAEEVYGALACRDKSAMEAVAVNLEEFTRHRILERVAWVDDADTWATIRAQEKRAILTGKNNLGDALRRSLAGYRTKRLIADACPHYYRDPKKTYTIKLPVDLGDLTRDMVRCGRDDAYKTVEQCKHCWQRGSTVDGVLHEGQRFAPIKK